MRKVVLVVLVLAGCQQAPAEERQKTDEEEIAEFCNTIAAEMVANPNSYEPLRKLQKKHLEEEWSFEDVDRICADAISRKTALMYDN